ncbi:hypothetical protein [Brevibacillus borstelensis]|uniref:hypothetical protein n=1 Tax=Brevibacillus borstelensis TaxID=45462 RepID=UPI002E24583D|nr:hypothetical protein [Brevibacillus borstelensis]
MNKKLVLSVLSTAVLTSMAASAMALEPGFYVGGNVDKYYSTTALSKNFKVAVKEVLKQPTVYVDKEGKAANFVEALFADDINTVLKPATPDMFEDDDYKIVGTDKVWNKKGEDWPPVPGTDLKVESVSAINGTEVIVKLASVPAELPLPGSFTVSDSNGKVYAVTQIAQTTTGEYKLTLGTAVEGKGTLTVKHGDSQASKDFDTTILGLKLGITLADDDARLVADGADNTIITVTVKRDGVVDENFKGEVKFQSLKNAKFAKEAVAFDKGVAQVQVTSVSSPVVVNDTIIATISEAEDPEFIGQSTSINLQYVPKDVIGDIDKKVFVTNAESDRASDVYVKFNDKFDFDKLYTDWTENPAIIKVSGKGLNSLDTVVREVLDLVKVDDRTIKLVLAESQALRDNSTVTVEVEDDRIEGLLQKSSIPFNLVDPDAPKAVKVTAPDYKTLVAEFTEPVSVTTAEEVSNWVLNGHQLTKADADITVGNIINEDGDVASYVKPDGSNPAIDNRHFVTIKLTEEGIKNYKATGAKNLLQAYNINDYAGLTDRTGQNTATTQEFEFVTPSAPGAATVSFVEQSPEQFKVEFNEVVVKTKGNDADLTIGDFVIERQVGFEADGVTPKWEAFNPDNQDLFKLELNKDGKNPKVYYLELLNDWTVIHDTNSKNINYYTPGYNKLRFTLKANAVKSKRTGVVIDKEIQDTITLDIDDKAPTFTAEQVVVDKVPQKQVAITMSEPIQMVVIEKDENGNERPVPVNTEKVTPGQKQKEVPVPTYEFVSADKKTTILGKLVPGSLTEDDTQFIIEPIEPDKLTAGEWTVYIRSISDDVGNTSDTLKQTLTIQPTEEEKGKPQIIWAEAIDNIDTYVDDKFKAEDVIVIQYGTEMSLEALKSNIYTVNAKSLPTGVKITSTDAEYTASGLKGTRVTITLPKDFLGETHDKLVGTVSEPHMLNVNKRLTDAKGTRIEGPTEVELTYNLKKDVYTIPALDQLVKGDNGVVEPEPTPAQKALTAINSGTYTVEDLKTAGVKAVDDAKFDDYKTAIDAAKAAKNDDLTLEEVQAEVTKVNETPAP